MTAGRSKARKRKHEHYINRELSWLEFNGRVLEEAQDPSNPLLERLRFCTIVASNLDEFFMVRVAGLKRDVEDGRTSPDKAGLTPAQQLDRISEIVHAMVGSLHRTLTDEIMPRLAKRGIQLVPLQSLDPGQRDPLRRYFQRDVLPALTPLAIDSSRPFPMLASLTLNLAVLLEPAEEESQPRLAVVQVPAGLPRIVRPAGTDGNTYVWMEEIIASELSALLPGQRILQWAAFRLARDSELELDEDGERDLREEVEEELRRRRGSQFVRLEIEAHASEELLRVLARRLEVPEREIYKIPGPVDVRALGQLADLPALEDLRYVPLSPIVPPESETAEDPFHLLDERDLLLHHPYDSFDPVVALLGRAADDPDVLAIKQTLYRTSGDSPVVRALMRAADKGKQVTAVIELRARFDEQSNIEWTRRLEKAGAHVIYGVRRYKTHAKICLIVRRGRDGIRRYVHLGTGNYNDKTARLYTDFGLMTSDALIGEDASMFFNAMTGYSDPPHMRKLVMAPTQLRERTLDLIRRETRRAEAGQPAEIRAKVNSLLDEEVIRALYDASAAGVQIRLNVRGICCLRPGLKGLSEKIQVVSIVGRFLEHSRIFYFRNGGDEEVYLSSADLMPRNLDRRIELLFPVEDPDCRRKLLNALDSMFFDNVKSRWLQADGTYRRRPRKGEERFEAQRHLYGEAERSRERARSASRLVIEPVKAPGGRG
jgi:polyphosphate kinase